MESVKIGLTKDSHRRKCLRSGVCGLSVLVGLRSVGLLGLGSRSGVGPNGLGSDQAKCMIEQDKPDNSRLFWALECPSWG